MAEVHSNQQGLGASGGDPQIHPRAKEFDIPKFVMSKHAALINMILETKSMDDKERQYWFHILPIMSTKQVDKLRAILNKEKTKLSQIDQQYKNKIAGIQKDKVNKWEEKGLKEKFAKIKKQEQSAEEEEKAAEEELLKKLEDI